MATLYINEYAQLPQLAGGAPQIAAEPCVATQTVSYTGTAGQSTAFNAQTKFIGITSPGIFSYKVGADNTVTATTSNFRIPADTIIFMAVPPAGYISAIVNT